MASRPSVARLAQRGALPIAGALVALGVLTAAARPAEERRVTVFFTSAVQGTLEPCGCNSDPLGGLDRYAALVRSAQRRGPVLLIDGGNASFPLGPVSPQRRAAAELRAAFVSEQLGKLGLAGTVPGGTDLTRLAAGTTAPRAASMPPLLAANLPGVPGVSASRIVTVGGIRVGLLGVADTGEPSGGAPAAANPVTAAVDEAQTLRGRGAELVVVLCAGDRNLGRRIAARADVDLVVLGKATGDGLEQPLRVGKAYLLAAGEELQRAGMLELVLPRDGGPLQDAGSPAEHARRREALAARIASLRKQLAEWRQQAPGSGVDPGFIAARTAELEALVAEERELASTPWRAPESGAYFVHQLVPIRRGLPRDAQVLRAMKSLDRAIARVNLRQATPPPPPEPGRPHYVGAQACARCHQPETRFWRATVHARAWTTLVKDGKQFDLECVSCHVTGYGEVGGSALGFTRDARRKVNLEAVQCETCHGPGSQHVAEEGLEEPLALRLDTPETVCVNCHNEKHSDTFQYEAYLRDVLGPGHGGKRRAALGDGPTGHALRSAALARAKQAGRAALRQTGARL